MISLEDIRRRAANVLPSTVFQRYGDSPTIRSYTDWSVFEDAFKLPPSAGAVSGADPVDVLPSFSFDPSASRMLAHHFANLLSAFSANGGTITLRSDRGALTLQHVILCVHGDKAVNLRDVAGDGPKSATVDVLVSPGAALNLRLALFGEHPQYLHLRYHLGDRSRVSVRAAVVGNNAHVHHEFFLNGAKSVLRYTGASLRGRSDVITDVYVRGREDFAHVSHALFSAPSDFLVHRGLLRVDRGSSMADADMDSAFYTTGGLAISVPALEVLTDNVVRASHRSRDLSLGDEQVFYLRSRGLSGADVLDVYVSSLLEHYLGDLVSDGAVRSAVRSFSESI